MNASLLVGMWLRFRQHPADLLIVVHSEYAAVCWFCCSLPYCSIKWDISNAGTITNYMVNLHTVVATNIIQ